MKRFLVALLAVLGISTSEAATYHVRPQGSDGSSGLSYAASWKTISKANKSARPGDKVYIYTGSYSHFPNPDSGGSSPGRITFIGVSTSGDVLTRIPDNYTTSTGAKSWLGSSIIVPAGTLTKPYVTLKGMRINGNLTLTNQRDSVAYCEVAGGLFIQGADYCTVADCVVRGAQFAIGYSITHTAGTITHAATVSDTIINTRMMALVTGKTNGGGFRFGDTPIYVKGVIQDVTRRQYVDSLAWISNRVKVTNKVASTGGFGPGWNLMQVRNSLFKNSYYEYVNPNAQASKENYLALAIRDSCLNLTFRGDTLRALGNGQNRLLWAGSSTYPNTVRNLTIDSCRVDSRNGPAAYFEIAYALTFTYNVLSSESYSAFSSQKFFGRSVIDHNTFSSNKGQDLPSNMGTVSFGTSTFTSSDSVLFYNNIVHNWTTLGAGAGNAIDRVHALGVDLVTTEVPFKLLVRSSWNLYSIWPYRKNPGDRSIGWQIPGGSIRSSLPGDGFLWESSYPAKDSLSYFGSAQFDRGGPDSTFVVGDSLLNPEVGDSSIAIGRGKNGTTIGARSYVTSPILGISSGSVGIFTGNESSPPETSTVTITNLGSASLDLCGPATSHQNLSASFGSTLLAAGESTIMTLVFKGATLTDFPTFAMVVEFSTNDPNHPTYQVQASYNAGGGPELPPGPVEGVPPGEVLPP